MIAVRPYVQWPRVRLYNGERCSTPHRPTNQCGIRYRRFRLFDAQPWASKVNVIPQQFSRTFVSSSWCNITTVVTENWVYHQFIINAPWKTFQVSPKPVLCCWTIWFIWRKKWKKVTVAEAELHVGTTSLSNRDGSPLIIPLRHERILAFQLGSYRCKYTPRCWDW